MPRPHCESAGNSVSIQEEKDNVGAPNLPVMASTFQPAENVLHLQNLQTCPDNSILSRSMRSYVQHWSDASDREPTPTAVIRDGTHFGVCALLLRFQRTRTSHLEE